MADPKWEETEPVAQGESVPKWEETAPVQASGSTPYAASASAGLFSGIPGAPQLGAAGKTAMDVLTGITDPSDALGEYKNERDSLKEDLRAKKETHPIAGAAGSLAGMAMLPVAPTAEGMAAYGAAQGLSDSNADNLDGVVGDTLKGGAVGGVLGGAAETAMPFVQKGLSTVSKPVADYLRGLAEKKAVSATGATGIQAGKFADSAGRELLDRGIVGFGDSQAQIAGKAQQAIDQSGQGISNTLNQLDQQGVSVDRNTVLNYLRNKIASLSGNEGEKGLVKQLEGKVADIEEQVPATSADVAAENAAEEAPSAQIPIGKSEEIKRSFDARAKWNSNSDADALEANRIAANAYRQASEDAATTANPELAGKFQQDKDTYSLLKPVSDAANKRAMTTAQSPAGGFLDTAASAAGAMTAGAPGAFIAPALRRAIAPRLFSAEAVGADFLGNLVRTAPQSLGKYQSVLTQAAARGGTSLAATDYLLQTTDPEYRRTLQSVKSSVTGQDQE